MVWYVTTILSLIQGVKTYVPAGSPYNFQRMHCSLPRLGASPAHRVHAHGSFLIADRLVGIDSLVNWWVGDSEAVWRPNIARVLVTLCDFTLMGLLIFVWMVFADCSAVVLTLGYPNSLKNSWTYHSLMGICTPYSTSYESEWKQIPHNPAFVRRYYIIAFIEKEWRGCILTSWIIICLLQNVSFIESPLETQTKLHSNPWINLSFCELVSFQEFWELSSDVWIFFDASHTPRCMCMMRLSSKSIQFYTTKQV